MVDVVDPRDASASRAEPAGHLLSVAITLDSPDLLVLSARGDIDLYTAPILRQALAVRPPAQHTVLDLTGVPFCGVAGAKVFDEFSRERRLSLVVATVGVRRLLELTGLSDRIPTHTRLVEALSAEPGGAGTGQGPIHGAGCW